MGANGYKSIIETMSKICGKTEKEIITNYELFSELAEGVFGRLANSKILDPIKFEIDKIGIENIYQEEKEVVKRPTRILIAEDDSTILGLYETFLMQKIKKSQQQLMVTNVLKHIKEKTFLNNQKIILM